MSATATTTAPDSPAAAEQARDQARRVRAQCDAARADAAGIVTAARAQLAEAERRAADLAEAVRLAEQIAEHLDTRARVIDHGRTFGQQAEQAEQQAGALAAEYAALTESAAGIEARLGEIAQQREDAAGRVAVALEAGDVSAVTALRPQLAALDEVAADLGARLEAARARAGRIGRPETGGLLAEALRSARSHGERHAQFLEQWLDPAALDSRERSTVATYARRAREASGEVEASRHAALLAILGEQPAFAAALTDARVR